jgi:hypothetical protein
MICDMYPFNGGPWLCIYHIYCMDMTLFTLREILTRSTTGLLRIPFPTTYGHEIQTAHDFWESKRRRQQCLPGRHYGARNRVFCILDKVSSGRETSAPLRSASVVSVNQYPEWNISNPTSPYSLSQWRALIDSKPPRWCSVREYRFVQTWHWEYGTREEDMQPFCGEDLLLDW